MEMMDQRIDKETASEIACILVSESLISTRGLKKISSKKFWRYLLSNVLGIIFSLILKSIVAIIQIDPNSTISIFLDIMLLITLVCFTVSFILSVITLAYYFYLTRLIYNDARWGVLEITEEFIRYKLGKEVHQVGVEQIRHIIVGKSSVIFRPDIKTSFLYVAKKEEMCIEDLKKYFHCQIYFVEDE